MLELLQSVQHSESTLRKQDEDMSQMRVYPRSGGGQPIPFILN